MRAGFSMVEIVLAMTILALLMAVSIATFMGEVERSEGTVGAGLCRDLAGAIERWQLESRRPWFSTRGPPGFPVDPWGHAFRIDPATARFWSSGKDGVDDHGTPGKDLVGSYPVWPTAGLESPRKITVLPTGPSRITVRWEPPPKAEEAIGFRVTRRSDATLEWSTVATVSPTEPPEVDDPNVSPGTTWYYRVQSLPGPAVGNPPPASAPVGAVLPATSSPQLELWAQPMTVDAGSSIELKARGKAGGSPLSHLVWAGSQVPVPAGEVQLTIAVEMPGAGSVVLAADLYDQAGQVTRRTVTVEVY